MEPNRVNMNKDPRKMLEFQKDWVAECMGREMRFENHFLGQMGKRDRGPRK